MRKLLLLALTCSISTPVTGVRAQATAEPYFSFSAPTAAYDEIADVPCPLYLNWGFNNYQPVRHETGEFKTVWRSENQTPPRPSYNWYEASPDRTILSVDGGLRWHDARMQAHCYGTRGYYGLTLHAHPFATEGRTEIVRCTSKYLVDPIDYDPYDPDAGGADCSSEENGGGGGGGAGSNCRTEYIVIEVSYDGGSTWSTFWEGNAQVCG